MVCVKPGPPGLMFYMWFVSGNMQSTLFDRFGFRRIPLYCCRLEHWKCPVSFLVSHFPASRTPSTFSSNGHCPPHQTRLPDDPSSHVCVRQLKSFSPICIRLFVCVRVCVCVKQFRPAQLTQPTGLFNLNQVDFRPIFTEFDLVLFGSTYFQLIFDRFSTIFDNLRTITLV